MPAAVARATELIGSMRHLLWLAKQSGRLARTTSGFGRLVTAH
jgi:hypothetical protein